MRGARDAKLSEFGHLVETFAVNELLKQGRLGADPVELRHFRTKDDHEVDLVIESDDGAVAVVEVKAKSSIDDKDFRGLRMLRDRLGTSFLSVALINLGRRSHRYDDRLYAMPLDCLWTRGHNALTTRLVLTSRGLRGKSLVKAVSEQDDSGCLRDRHGVSDWALCYDQSAVTGADQSLSAKRSERGPT